MLFLIVFASHLFILGVGGAAVCIADTKLTRRKRAQIKENEEWRRYEEWKDNKEGNWILFW